MRSMAILFGRRTISLCGIAAAGFLSLFGYSGMLNRQGWPFFGSLVIAGAIIARRLAKTDIDCKEDCKRFFIGSKYVSVVLAVGLAVDAMKSRIESGIRL